MTTDEKSPRLTRTQRIWGGYAKCEDGCGAEAGEVCRTDDDKKAEAPCTGRKLRPGPPKSPPTPLLPTMCKRGHVLAPDNIYWKRGHTQRECRRCSLDATKARRDKARAAKKATKKQVTT